jgi:hypothetical protein
VRRVQVAFDLAAENTNLPVSPQFVVLLANCFRWLAPEGQARPTYGYVSPLDAVGERGWRVVEGGPPDWAQDRPGPLPWGGLYRDEAGILHAVNVLGLRSARPAVPPGEAIAAAPLPQPEMFERGVAIWPLPAALAVLFWLAGWTLRVR